MINKEKELPTRVKLSKPTTDTEWASKNITVAIFTYLQTTPPLNH